MARSPRSRQLAGLVGNLLLEMRLFEVLLRRDGGAGRGVGGRVSGFASLWRLGRLIGGTCALGLLGMKSVLFCELGFLGASFFGFWK